MNSVQAIIDERAANGPFKSIFDFVERINLSSCNRKTIESLAVSGAFDCFSDIQREDFFAKKLFASLAFSAVAPPKPKY